MSIKRGIFLVCVFFSSLLFLTPSFAYINYSLEEPLPGLAGNSVIEIIYDGNNIWIGTGNGLSYSPDSGGNWLSFDHTNGLNSDGISAIGYKDSRLWVALSYNQLIDGVLIPYGAGFNMTTDQGANWNSFKPSQANSVGQLAYDITLSDSTIWAACFYGGLIRSKDYGSNWENVFIDSTAEADFYNSNYEDLRNRFFSVVADSSSNGDTTFIWGGTAAGIFKFVYTTSDTADTVITYQHVDTISTSISGNFVISLAVQELDGRKIVWAGTQPTYSGIYALNYTTDGGETWSYTLEGDRVWNIDFSRNGSGGQDSTVWVATSSGLKRSNDFGYSWDVYNFMQDKDKPDQQILNPEFYAVRMAGSTIWAGGFDGLVKSTDNGISWKVYRTFVPIGSAEAKTSYAYPNPFSPLVANEKVRIHFKPKADGYVTIKIYDFEMKLVKTLIENAEKFAGEEYDELWDGKNEKGDNVANGIYFFKLEGPGGQEEWGKIGIVK